MHQDQNSDSRRRRWMKRAVIAFVVVAAAAWLLAGPAQRNADQRAAVEFAEQAAPQVDTSTVMLLPASKDWYALLEGMTNGEMNLVDVPFPTHAKWLGYSEGRSQERPAEAHAAFATGLRAVYLGFEDHAAAEAYREHVADQYEVSTYMTTRANMVILTTPGTFVESETWRPEIASFDGTVSAATVRMNLTEAAMQLVENGRYPRQTRQLVAALGVSLDRDHPTMWTASSDQVAGWFRGDLSDFEKEQATSSALVEANTAMTATAKVECNGANCVTWDDGMAMLWKTGIVQVGSQGYGDTAATGLQAGDEDVLVSLDILPTAFRSILLNAEVNDTSTVRSFSARVPDSDHMRGRWTLQPDAADRFKTITADALK